ncbi:T-cell-interacting, activating receptor on myeloid cells protein 1-like [Myotis lucifugus]|uniref:T-cell-interacting, activating receptor on myeloid cells protein 1-like n=1 Tax=Myotis lucifugus TaxID=59463 RepID=UPI000CCBEA85|nr:T-cell-interacting, activating receptor on myeloid cells protein 1-like [Myotis lucifugus]
MIPEFLSLLLFGLCVGQRDIRRDESFPRPSIHAWPSSMVPANSNVTVRCSTTSREVNFRDVKFALKGGRNVMESSPSSDSPGGLVEFHLSGVKTSDAGEYTCEYYRKGSPTRRSPPSDVLLLLVTGNFPKPSLKAHQRGEMTAGENMILQCQKPRHVIQPHMFALLKKGTSTPIKLQSAVGMETDFSLPSVTGSDTGAYSCVYYQPRAPFWASEPSDHLMILVTDSPGATSTDYTTGNLIRLCLSAVIMVLMVAFLLEACWSQKWSRCGSSSEDPIIVEELKQVPQLPGETMGT